MADYKDYYKILGVDKKAGDADIKKAFKTMARKYHPDMHGEAQKAAMTEKFKDINEAYEVLSDKQKRSVYDQIGAGGYQNYARGGGAASGAASAGAYGRANPFGGGSYTYSNAGGANPFGGGNGGFNFHSTGGFEQGDFSDFFQQIFGGMGGANPFGGMGARGGRSSGGSYRQTPDLDSEADLTLSVEDAYRGGQMGLTLGDGKTVQVKLPAKIADGQRIKLKGLGAKSQVGAGDLFINIKIKPHPLYRVEGSDIYMVLDIMPWTAALGGCANVALPDGTSINIKVPAGVHSGSKVKLSGKGLGKAGDMFVQFMINNPKTLSKTQKELFAKLADS